MNFPTVENRLSPSQMEAYKKALRETGIFTEKEIEKYARKADMTFKEIINAEVGNRANYESTQAPKWEATVKAVEAKRQRNYARYSSQETDLDTETDSIYDGVKRETEQEVIPYGQKGKPEDYASFIRRMHEGSRRVKQIGGIIFGYAPSRLLYASRTAEDTYRELKRLGIRCFLHKGLEYNYGGKTYTDFGETGALIDGSVAIYDKAFGDGIEYAGHEAFHVLKKNSDRKAYVATLKKNINIFSSVYGIELADTVLKKYFGGNVEALASKEATSL